MDIAVVIPSYNSGARLARSVDGFLRQRVGVTHRLRIIVVDDGSTDGSVSGLQSIGNPLLHIVSLPSNRGRASARNAGILASDADLIVFVDADCVPCNEHCVAAHAETVERGSAVSIGDCRSNGTGFWGKLQDATREHRLQQVRTGNEWRSTTQNVAIVRSALMEVGAFDTSFDRYGFEDRDLFLRLRDAGARMCFTPDSCVVHEDDLRLRRVFLKMLEAGSCNARAFRLRHEKAYAELPFAKIDCDLRPALRLVDPLLWPLASLLSRVPDDWLEARWIPQSLRVAFVRLVYGAAYMHGTATGARGDATAPAAK